MSPKLLAARDMDLAIPGKGMKFSVSVSKISRYVREVLVPVRDVHLIKSIISFHFSKRHKGPTEVERKWFESLPLLRPLL